MQLLQRLNAKTRTDSSRLFVWMVDTTNEVKGEAATRYLLPSATRFFSITLNAPSVRLYALPLLLTLRCTAALKALFHSPSSSLRSAIDTSHGDLRQMCLKLLLFAHHDSSSLRALHSEDTFWGLFHMVKKLLLGKRRPDGRFENDFDTMFRDNAITVDDTLDYVYTNMPTYTSDLEECCAVMDDLALVESMRPKWGRSRDADQGGEGDQSLRNRVRFMVTALSPSIHNQYPTAAARSFSSVAAPRTRQLRDDRLLHKQCVGAVLDRLYAVEDCRVGWREFVLAYPSLLLSIYRPLLEDMHLTGSAESAKQKGLVDLVQFRDSLSVLMDMHDVGLEARGDL